MVTLKSVQLTRSLLTLLVRKNLGFVKRKVVLSQGSCLSVEDGHRRGPTLRTPYWLLERSRSVLDIAPVFFLVNYSDVNWIVSKATVPFSPFQLSS